LVDRSRGFALVRNWRRYQSVGGRFATRIPRPPSSWWLAVERERTGRAIDVLTGMMLTRIANSQPFDEDAFVQRVAELERMAYLEADSPVTPAFEAPALTERLELMGQTDRRLAALRDSIEETLEP
jgi:hypothetical protein